MVPREADKVSPAAAEAALSLERTSERGETSMASQKAGGTFPAGFTDKMSK